jgi:hypothetical protein
MTRSSWDKGWIVRRNLFLFFVAMLLSGCIEVRFIDGENNSDWPEVTSLPGVETDISPTISPSPRMISTAAKQINIPQPAIKPDTWYFFAVTRQGRTIIIYMDGRAVSFGDFWPSDLDAPVSLKFGRRAGSQSMYLNGRIDEVEIYNGTALTPQEIYAIYIAGSYGKCKNTITPNCVPPPAGLTGWWPADGHADDIVTSLNGELLRDATIGPGLANKAFVLDGEGDYIEVPDDPALNFGTRDFTLDLWVYFNSVSYSQVMIEKWIQEEKDPYSHGWTLELNNNWVSFVWGDGVTHGTLGIQFQTSPIATPTKTQTPSPAVSPTKIITPTP